MSSTSWLITLGWRDCGPAFSSGVTTNQGQKLGRCVARLVISQSDGVPKPSKPPAHTPANEQKPPPSKEDLRIQSYKERSRCLHEATENRCFPPIPNCDDDNDKGPHAAQSVQQGAR